MKTRVIGMLGLIFLCNPAWALEQYKPSKADGKIIHFYFKCDDDKKITVVGRVDNETVQVLGKSIWLEDSPTGLATKACKGKK